MLWGGKSRLTALWENQTGLLWEPSYFLTEAEAQMCFRNKDF